MCAAAVQIWVQSCKCACACFHLLLHAHKWKCKALSKSLYDLCTSLKTQNDKTDCNCLQ